MPFTYDLLEPGLALSAAPETSDELVDVPFGAVLNVSDCHLPCYAAALHPGLLVVRWPFEDSIPAPLPFLTAAVLELAELRTRGVPTLVHCQQGQSRSPAVVALYWMARDALSWDEAIAKIASARPCAAPHPALVDDGCRFAVVERARAFLAGDISVLYDTRAAARQLFQADLDREPEPQARQADWDLVEEGLGLGGYPQPLSELIRHGFDHFLNVAAFGGSSSYQGGLPGHARQAGFAVRDDEPVDPRIVASAVCQLQVWRSQGRMVYVHDLEGRSPAVLVVCLYLMLERGWDYASVLWYVRRRRRQAWPRPDLLAKFTIEKLLAFSRDANMSVNQGTVKATTEGKE